MRCSNLSFWQTHYPMTVARCLCWVNEARLMSPAEEIVVSGKTGAASGRATQWSTPRNRTPQTNPDDNVRIRKRKVHVLHKIPASLDTVDISQRKRTIQRAVRKGRPTVGHKLWAVAVKGETTLSSAGNLEVRNTLLRIRVTHTSGGNLVEGRTTRRKVQHRVSSGACLNRTYFDKRHDRRCRGESHSQHRARQPHARVCRARTGGVQSLVGPSCRRESGRNS